MANVIVFNLGATVRRGPDHRRPVGPGARHLAAALHASPGGKSTYLGETGADDSAPGRDLRVCNIARPSHIIAGQFQRTDTGQSVIIPDPNLCVGDNDVSITKSDDLTVHAEQDLDHTETINITVTNGQVPANVDVSVSLVGPADCSPTLVPQPGDVNTTADVLTGPTTVGGQTSTRLDFTELGMAANEVRNITRDYVINCPAGWSLHLPGCCQRVDSAQRPRPSNNQDENHPIATVCCQRPATATATPTR